MVRRSYLVHGSLKSPPDELSGSMIDLDHYDSQVRELGMSRLLPLPRMDRGQLGRGRRRGNDEALALVGNLPRQSRSPLLLVQSPELKGEKTGKGDIPTGRVLRVRIHCLFGDSCIRPVLSGGSIK